MLLFFKGMVKLYHVTLGGFSKEPTTLEVAFDALGQLDEVTILELTGPFSFPSSFVRGN